MHIGVVCMGLTSAIIPPCVISWLWIYVKIMHIMSASNNVWIIGLFMLSVLCRHVVESSLQDLYPECCESVQLYLQTRCAQLSTWKPADATKWNYTTQDPWDADLHRIIIIITRRTGVAELQSRHFYVDNLAD